MPLLDDQKLKVPAKQSRESLHENFRAVFEFETAPISQVRSEYGFENKHNLVVDRDEIVDRESANCEIDEYEILDTDENDVLENIDHVENFSSTAVKDSSALVERIDESHITLLVPDRLPDRPNVTLEEALRRHRAIEGVFGRKKVEPSEHLLNVMSRSANDKTREIQKTTEENCGVKNLKEVKSAQVSQNVNKKPETNNKNAAQENNSKEKTGVSSSDSKVKNINKNNESQEPEIPDLITSLFSLPSPPVEQRLRSHGYKTTTAVTTKKIDAENSISDIIRGIHTVLPNVSVDWPLQVSRMQKNAAEQMSQLTDHLEANIASGVRSLAFCGCSPQCGCTTILLCCARELANRGWKTLIVDVNTEFSELQQTLDICSEQENEVVLQLEKNLDMLSLYNLISNTSSRNLSDKISETNIGQPHDITSDHHLVETLIQIAHEFDVVLFDCGNVGVESCVDNGVGSIGYSDADYLYELDSKLSRLVQLGADGALLILDGNCVKQEEIAPIEQRIKQFGIVRLGIAENTIGRARVA
ncbi:MAG: hypothetical protein ACRC2T_13035 [Thermoguttaceae bacterium]